MKAIYMYGNPVPIMVGKKSKVEQLIDLCTSGWVSANYLEKVIGRRFSARIHDAKQPKNGGYAFEKRPGSDGFDEWHITGKI